ncbi:uncharacterized protein LTHEOB_837 [Neofusicoccum parvum]|uniref:Uncharacterized protein LTHEOB_837 n=1 Tax=Neofusicoccum parvum TaxID=310453 RepID=A0ACB5S877_9PEZI|nr:uncharacterized protein LTHEOB_837 [Neofusicoccum parvum]
MTNLISAAVLTADDAPTNKPTKLIAVTSAIRATQVELKAKATLSLELAESEAAAMKKVEKEKSLVERREIEKHRWKGGSCDTSWKAEMRDAFRTMHRQGLWCLSGCCYCGWRKANEGPDQWEGALKKAEEARKAYEKAKEELRVLRLRREYAVRCVEALKAYLVDRRGERGSR